MRKCLNEIEVCKSVPCLPLKNAQCITKIVSILTESTVTPPLSELEINVLLLSYTEIIENSDGSLQ